jgi:hypothetical protein
MAYLSKKDLERPEVQDALEALRKLIEKKTGAKGNEFDGGDIVRRVAATIESEPCYSAFIERNKLDGPSKKTPAFAGYILGVDPYKLKEFEETNYRPPASDHDSLFDRDGKPAVFVTQPYSLGLEDLKDIVKYCEKYGLKVSISGLSWHFPGDTILIQYEKK